MSGRVRDLIVVAAVAVILLSAAAIAGWAGWTLAFGCTVLWALR